MPHLAPLISAQLALSPFTILALSVGFIVAAIALFRVHAFFAMMIAAMLVAVLSTAGSPGPHHYVQAIGSVTTAFGSAAGSLGFTLALAAVIGLSLMESGSAEKIVRCLVSAFGEGNAALALMVCGFLLAAPVFIDTVFMLLLPIARALSVRTGKNCLLYVLATCCGGIITNGTVPPAPGPLYVADHLRINLFVAILAGAVFGIIPAIGALIGARWFNSRMPIPARATRGESLESLAATAARPDSDLPGFWVSIAPVLAPFVLIAAASTLGILQNGSLSAVRLPPRLATTIGFLGDKNVALMIGAVLAVGTNVHRRKIGWRRAGTVLGAPLEVAAIIILIIASGSAYGDSIKGAGLGDAVRAAAAGHAISYVFVAWLLAVTLRAAQGSATVAMIAATGIVSSMAGPAGFGVHPLYILLAVGYGSKAMSWMNDAGFWLVSRVGGLTQGEALRSWSILATAVSVIGLIEILAVSSIWPKLPF
ncbi:MAG: SLC13 family permease [Opitutaceae bacterium]|jgi:GntP family gluconate:H+ symporter